MLSATYSNATNLRRLTYGLTFIAAMALIAPACRTASAGSEGAGSDRIVQSPVATQDEIPVGTHLKVALNQKLDTESTQVGDTFSATLIDPLMSDDGQEVVPPDAVVRGKVTGVVPSEGMGEQAAIRLDIEEIRFDGHRYPMSAEIVETDVVAERDKSDVATGAAVGGVAGLALGAIIGQSAGSAVIGGLLGAGTGTVVSLGVGTTNAELPAGSGMTLRTTEAVEVE